MSAIYVQVDVGASGLRTIVRDFIGASLSIASRIVSSYIIVSADRLLFSLNKSESLIISSKDLKSKFFSLRDEIVFKEII